MTPETPETPPRRASKLIQSYLAGFKGMRVFNTFDVVGEGPEFGFHVQCEQEILLVRTICGDRLLYVAGGQRGTATADHPVGAEVVRLD
jgi:hypothetical protein